MKFKPTLIPTLFTIPALIVLLSLGTWQLQRMQWKIDRIAEVNYKSSKEAVDFPVVIDDFESLEYRRFKVKGEFLHDKEAHLFTGPRVHRGKSGYDILTPLKMSDGRIVIVDRGWVPTSLKNAEKRADSLIQGVVEVEGMLHRGESKGRFTPDNNVEDNLWFWIDISALSSYVESPLQDLYIRVLKNEGGVANPVVPVAGEAVIKHKNDHLQYAITWYGLAIVLLVIYVLYHRKLVKK